MEILRYPSDDFHERVRVLIKKRAAFNVIVPRDYKHKNILKIKLATMYDDFRYDRNPFRSVYHTFLVLTFYMALGDVLAGTTYKIGYEDTGDLVIIFEPVESSS